MSELFKPCNIGTLTLKNRFVRSATEDWLGDAGGGISDAKLALYEQLAAGGVGTIITGHAYVSHPRGRAGISQTAIYDDRYLPGWQRLAAVVQKHGVKAILQLAHAGRQTAPDIIEEQLPVAPSDLLDEQGEEVAKGLSLAEMKRIVEDYGAAARRAQQAGFDGVQLHMAHGYLLAQFLSPFTNRRTDEYGGTTVRRTRFPVEVLCRVREIVGPDFPVWIKLNSTDGLPDTMQPQITLADVVETAAILADHSANVIEVSGGTIKETRMVMAKPGIVDEKDEGYFGAAVAAIKAKVNIPVIQVGGLRSLTVMQAVIDKGQADLISMSRPFIREPDLVNRLAAGQEKATCVSCNGCFNPKGIRCVLD
ncbi:MAG TPA: NADH:flavin oxidoreductase [Patescibacteria group bacterium]|nr:NADH:flavin oxidoreductase [Patescibacteria group bacterium]